MCALGQRAAPELKLRLITAKDNFFLNESVVVRAELTNATKQTLCFPPPDQDCSTPQVGWVVVEGYEASTGGGEQFICHVDGRGVVGEELDSAVKDRWIKLSPDGVYLTE